MLRGSPRRLVSITSDGPQQRARRRSSPPCQTERSLRRRPKAWQARRPIRPSDSAEVSFSTREDPAAATETPRPDVGEEFGKGELGRDVVDLAVACQLIPGSGIRVAAFQAER